MSHYDIWKQWGSNRKQSLHTVNNHKEYACKREIDTLLTEEFYNRQWYIILFSYPQIYHEAICIYTYVHVCVYAIYPVDTV